MTTEPFRVKCVAADTHNMIYPGQTYDAWIVPSGHYYRIRLPNGNDYFAVKSCFEILDHAVDNANPKDLIGATKPNLFLLPPTGILYGSLAMQDGARKYGPYNWREKDVRASIYIAAAMRHILSWQDGEHEAKDSGVHHLGHAIACLAILLDAEANEVLVDDRPVSGVFAELVGTHTKHRKDGDPK